MPTSTWFGFHRFFHRTARSSNVKKGSSCCNLARSSSPFWLKCPATSPDGEWPRRSASPGPADHSKYGYLSEHHTYGQTEAEAGDYAEDLAATMLATTLGIPFDPDKDYNARKEQYMIGGEIVDSTSITMAVTAAPGGIWTTVICGAVLI